MKIFFLALIIFMSIAAFYGVIPPDSLVYNYGVLAIAPFIFVFLKKNLTNTLLIWFSIALFKDFGTIPLPFIPDISPARIVWLLLIMFFMLDLIFKKRKIVPGDFKLEIAMTVILIYIVFSKMFAGTMMLKGHGLQLSFVLNGFVLPFSMFFLAKNLVNDEESIKKALLLLVVIGLYLGLTGIFEVYRLDFLVFPSYIMDVYKGIHFGQARGPFVNANVNGLTVGLIFLGSIVLYQTDIKKWRKKLLFFAMLCMLATILFTYNRATWLGFFIASLILPVYFPKMRIAYIVTVFLIVGSVFFMIALSPMKSAVDRKTKALEIIQLDVGSKFLHRFKSSSSMESRTRIMETAWKMFLDKPILGFGYQRFKVDSSEYFSEDTFSLWDQSKHAIAVHNSLVQLTVELGLVGISLFLFIFCYPLVIAVKLSRLAASRNLFGKELARIFIAAFIFYFVVMQGMEFHYFMFPNTIYYLFIGMISGLYQRYTTEFVEKQEVLS